MGAFFTGSLLGYNLTYEYCSATYFYVELG
jgi:hypothetical protein